MRRSSPLRPLFVVGLALSVSNCRDADTRERPAPPPVEVRASAPSGGAPTSAVIVVTIDGVRWQEIFGGADRALAAKAELSRSEVGEPRVLVPHMHRLFFERGAVLGDPALPGGIRASGPRFVSLPAYVEIMTGSRSPCRGNDCTPALDRTLMDEIAAAPDWVDGSVAAFTSWEILGRVASMDRSRVLVKAGREPKDDAPAYPGGGGYRPDHGTMALAVDHLLRHRPRFLWVALGDTDEWAHRNDYRGYLDALRAADRFVGELASHLEDMGDYGARAVLMVTTDHGRDADFSSHGGDKSGPVWLLARGGPIGRQGVIPTRELRYLRDIAPTVRALLRLPARGCPQCGVPIEELFEGPGVDDRRASAPARDPARP